jgi:hypothetical protein
MGRDVTYRSCGRSQSLGFGCMPPVRFAGSPRDSIVAGKANSDVIVNQIINQLLLPGAASRGRVCNYVPIFI